MGNAARAVWTEPRAANPPARVWRDWALVAVLACVGVLEHVLRQDMPWRGIGLVELAVLAVALLGRRTRPLAMLTLAFGVAIVVDVASIAAHAGASVSPYTMGFLLVLPYALFRWGSGREVVLGSAVALLGYVDGIVRDHTTITDSTIGFVILLFPMVLGASVRFWSSARARQLDQVRLREREQLARELHDTVAHHVSAMVIRAQAGRVVAESHPGAAVEALQIIEAEGSRTLAEMRRLVGALRDGDVAALAPQNGVADLERLASSAGERPEVDVQLRGRLEDLTPSVGTAVYRIAQESVTNAQRHARRAQHITVMVTGGDDDVTVKVTDDGEPVPSARGLDGFGLVGMAERATLLGGRCVAGPGDPRGWVVDATLPRLGPAS